MFIDHFVSQAELVVGEIQMMTLVLYHPYRHRYIENATWSELSDLPDEYVSNDKQSGTRPFDSTGIEYYCIASFRNPLELSIYMLSKISQCSAIFSFAVDLVAINFKSVDPQRTLKGFLS